jgi:hypothetical protein
MRHPSVRSCMPSLTLLALLLLHAAPAGAAVQETIDGVLHVRNGAEPRDGVEQLRLQEIWRAGDADDEVLFGLVTRVVENDAGELLVLDAQLSRVHVYDRDGRHLRTLFGEGEGPGEVRGPRDIVLLGDGRVGVVQEVPGKLIFVDRENTPAGELRIGGPGVAHGGMCQTFSAFAGGDLLLVAGFVQSPGSVQGHMIQTSFLGRFDAEGREIASFCRTENDIDFADFTFDENRHLASYWWNAAVGPDGRVYVAPRLDRYEIHVFDGDGRLERVIERAYEPWRRTTADRQRFVGIVEAIYADAPIDVGVAPSDFEPAIVAIQRGLRVHADGTIWVLTTHGIRDQEPGVMATFDVFSPSGEYLRRSVVHFDADAAHDGVFLFSDGLAVVVKGFVDAMWAQFTGGRVAVDVGEDTEATMEVVCCRVAR